jgi:glycerate kinase
LGARLEYGFDLLAKLTGLTQQIGEMDLVLTGEGSFDSQSLFGKLPFKIAKLTQKQKIPTLIIAGQTHMSRLPNMSHVKIYNSQPENMSLGEALKKAPHLLEVKLLEVLEAFKLKNKRL